MVHGLLERGWDAQLVLGAGAGAAEAPPPELDALLRARRLHVAEQAPRRLRRARSVETLVRKLDPHVVHFFRADHARAHLDVAATVASKVVVTFSAADASVAGLDVPDYFQPLWSQADLLHFPDDAVLDRTVRRGLSDGKPRAVIPPFVDPRAFRPDRRPDAERRPLRILCAGRLDWAGGYEHGLHAVALAAERGVACDCRVAGGGPHLPALLFARLQLGLAGTVSFEDALTSQDLLRQLAWADVFLAPTVVDGLPDHVAEAAAMELALVLADPGRLGELELDESVAITVPRRDPEALAQGLSALAGDPARRARMGSAARAWALDRFPLDQHLDRLESLYRRIAG